jgi:hypothetical protein
VFTDYDKVLPCCVMCNRLHGRRGLNPPDTRNCSLCGHKAKGSGLHIFSSPLVCSLCDCRCCADCSSKKVVLEGAEVNTWIRIRIRTEMIQLASYIR